MWDQDELTAGYDAAVADYGAPAPIVELAVIDDLLYISLKGSDRQLLAEYSYTLDGTLTRVGG
tara:strand:- start:278 stop:466 length:189 start_codon:yes stop_codon:yes gene_type:complete